MTQLTEAQLQFSQQIAPGQMLALQMNKVLGDAGFEDRMYALAVLLAVSGVICSDSAEAADGYVDGICEIAKTFVPSVFHAHTSGGMQ